MKISWFIPSWSTLVLLCSFCSVVTIFFSFVNFIRTVLFFVICRSDLISVPPQTCDDQYWTALRKKKGFLRLAVHHINHSVATTGHILKKKTWLSLIQDTVYNKTSTHVFVLRRNTAAGKPAEMFSKTQKTHKGGYSRWTNKLYIHTVLLPLQETKNQDC